MDSKPGDTYIHGYSETHRRFLSMRSAAVDAAFFVPHLRPGMRVVDCGCGQGAITIGLAEAVAPGEVVGIDHEPSQVEAARAWAAEHGAPANCRFAVGSVYELPFPDASLDAAFAHTVLEHVSDPLRALREMRRVLKPGGVVGIKDPDYGTLLHAPSSPLADEGLALYRRVSVHNGASPYYARHQRALLREAGFVRTDATTVAIGGGNDAMWPALYDMTLKTWLLEPAFVRVALEQGWADEARLEAMRQAVAQTFTGPDAFFTLTMCAAIGFVPEG